jgi:Rhodopirellula transposase DDE domain
MGMLRPKSSSRRGCRSFPWTPRKRNWWETTVTAAKNGNRKEKATEFRIMTDAGGSNATRARLWRVGVQRLANLTGLHIHVSHFPPGTSKWNKNEHGMFSFITKNWRGRPLLSYQNLSSI